MIYPTMGDFEGWRQFGMSSPPLPHLNLFDQVSHAITECRETQTWDIQNLRQLKEWFEKNSLRYVSCAIGQNMSNLEMSVDFELAHYSLHTFIRECSERTT